MDCTVRVDYGSGEIFGDCLKRCLRNALAYTILWNASVFVKGGILVKTTLVDVAWLWYDELDFVVDVQLSERTGRARRREQPIQAAGDVIVDAGISLNVASVSTFAITLVLNGERLVHISLLTSEHLRH